MAKLTCACYASPDFQPGLVVPVFVEPPVGVIVVDFTAGAAKGGAAFPSGTKYVEITSDTACHWRIQLQSDAAAASTSDKMLGAGVPLARRIPDSLVNLDWGISAVVQS